MLSGKQKRYLRSLAHHLDPIIQVGKGGVNPMLIRQLQEALEARELIKISILQNATEDKEKIAGQLANGTGAEIVQTIGRTVVLYKESQKKKTIELP